jgi:hypothetical protein
MGMNSMNVSHTTVTDKPVAKPGNGLRDFFEYNSFQKLILDALEVVSSGETEHTGGMNWQGSRCLTLIA